MRVVTQVRYVHSGRCVNHQQEATSVMNAGELINLPILKNGYQMDYVDTEDRIANSVDIMAVDVIILSSYIISSCGSQIDH
jgi:hypothetical protein